MEYTAKGLPKVIHYCWFGRGEKSPLIQRCIATWREKMPGWEIREWNEDNFDVTSIPYTAEAYGAKKYAFVADYARFWILYHFGGVCLCTDVELLRPVDDLLDETPCLMGFELRDTINPGSIISAYTTEMLRRHGFTGGNRMQQVGNFVLYPSEYFCPFEHETQMVVKTENTRSIHHFSATWSPWWRKARFRAIGLAARLLGRERYLALKHCIKK